MIDDVGSSTAIIAVIALLIAAVSGFLTRNWVVAVLVGSLAGGLFFYTEFQPSDAAEMVVPLTYFAIPALIGALIGVWVRKGRGVS